MIHKQATITRVQTMADGSIRLVIDLLNGNAEDIKNAFIMQNTETSIILTPTEDIVDTVQQVAHQLL